MFTDGYPKVVQMPN